MASFGPMMNVHLNTKNYLWRTSEISGNKPTQRFHLRSKAAIENLNPLVAGVQQKKYMLNKATAFSRRLM